MTGLGVDVNRLRRDVGIVFQTYNLFPHMTVLDNVTLAPAGCSAWRRAAEERAVELLERVGLADKADAYPDRLSGGQQQRVAIVRALAMDPRCCCSTRSPPRSTRSWSARCSTIVRDLAEGMTMLLATHEMGFAREIADAGLLPGPGPDPRAGAAAQIFSTPARSAPGSSWPGCSPPAPPERSRT